jgi:hypothetical protein
MKLSKKDKELVESVLTIKFSNNAAAKHFALWLCESGEQEYWEWMKYREQEEKTGDITATSFHYHGQEDETKAKNDPARYIGLEFMSDNIIRTDCGRLDKDE